MADGSTDINAKPTEEISVRDVFGIDTDMAVKGFAERSDRVPAIDPTYKFDPETTLAILAGFALCAAIRSVTSIGRLPTTWSIPLMTI